MRSHHSPDSDSRRHFTLDLCSIALSPSSVSGRKSSQTPKGFLNAQCSGFGSQSLKSPTRASDLAAGAHSLYQMPCFPSCSPLLKPNFLYPWENASRPPSFSSMACRRLLYLPYLSLMWSAWDQSVGSNLRHSVPSPSGTEGVPYISSMA